MSESLETQSLSLVDLVKILYFRRYVFLASFGLIMVLGVFYVFSRDAAYQYSSYYSLGLLDEGAYLESPKATELRVKEVGYPAIVDERRSADDGGARIDIAIDSNSDAGVIRIVTFAPKSIEKEVIEVHEALLQFINSRQVRRHERQKKAYEAELESVVETLNSEAGVALNPASLPVLIQKKADLERALRSMVRGETIVTARVSDKPSGVSKVIILMGLLVVSTIFGLIFAYLAKFFAIVRESLERDTRYGG